MFFTDLCGFSTLIYPFIILLKNKVLTDYMYYLGAVFAFSSLVYPNNIDGDALYAYNTIRFFFAHTILVAVPVLLVTWKMHTPNIKNLGYMFLFLLMGGIYNMALTAFFVEVGLRDNLANYMGLWCNGNERQHGGACSRCGSGYFQGFYRLTWRWHSYGRWECRCSRLGADHIPCQAVSGGDLRAGIRIFKGIQQTIYSQWAYKPKNTRTDRPTGEDCRNKLDII